ncbi:Regulatory protein cys-3 [Purpureocillium lilacinum]|uniref:Regulatory protein cys-3 n=1 Tax=Purpureocillium lilacinum TaxID=33203 RepID=A0A2U3EHT5_PURLI|nr:Regulatory protein cys-3 [Purpureocillium lilacinum]
MSTYNGRHGPNVSQYLRDLNTISPQDTTAPEEGFNMEDDLSLFTNTQFFDFDSGQNLDYQAQPIKPDGKSAGRHSSNASDEATTAAPSVIGDMPNLDFMSGDFNFTEFNNAYASPSMNTFPDGASTFPPLQPNHAAVQAHQSQAQFRQGAARAAEKRKAEAMTAPTPQLNFEEASRVAAEEDKRRRNTAASARFRIKKKQREQALEKSAKEMTDKITSLEGKVSQLETENKWLKNLLVEKNEGSDDITALWKEFTKHATEKTKAASAASEAAKEER